MAGSARSGAQAIERAMAVLDCFAGDRVRTLSELAAESGLALSTTHRIVQALWRNGYLERQSGVYRVGPRVHALAPRTDLMIDEVVPHLYALAAGIKLTVSLGVPGRSAVARIATARPPVEHCASQCPGDREPLHATAMGKALLAFSPDGPAAAVRRLNGLESFTARTPTSRGVLVSQLAEVRHRGYAIADQERTDGVRELAVPVMGGGRAVAALGVQDRSTRMTNDLAMRILPALRQAAAVVGSRLPAMSDAG